MDNERPRPALSGAFVFASVEDAPYFGVDWTRANVSGERLMHVEEAKEFSEELLLGVRALCRELTPEAPPPPLPPERLREILEGESCRLLLARGPRGELAGMLVLASYPIPTGERFWIEDVAVAGEARGQGIGEALVRRALELAREAGAETVDLTCRPARAAANRLYQRVGFVRRKTNTYRYDLRGEHR